MGVMSVFVIFSDNDVEDVDFFVLVCKVIK